MPDIEKRFLVVAGGILDGPADEARLCRQSNRFGRGFRRVTKAPLQIAGDGNLSSPGNGAGVGQRLLASDVSIAVLNCQWRWPVVRSPPVRSIIVFSMLFTIKVLSRIFYRVDLRWVGDVPENPWSNIQLVAFLNHTSLFEPLFLGGVPNSFLWRLARHGVIPAADKTTGRPLVGMVFKFVAHNVVAISRERDHTWFAVLSKIDPDSMVVIAPEGRMRRANGLDSNGQPMTVRGGISDIIEAVGEGKLVLAYSGGLHHVQIPGRRPRAFKTIRVRLEALDLSSYRSVLLAKAGPHGFKKAVMADLDHRRDRLAPIDGD